MDQPDYAQIVRLCKERYDIRVHRWRTAMAGCAWRADYADGSSIRWIESPFPRSPISLAIFLHEIGHHVIGFDTCGTRCEEELGAWDWAIAMMRALGIPPDARVLRRYDRSMREAVGKAMRRITRANSRLNGGSPLHIHPTLPLSLRRFSA